MGTPHAPLQDDEYLGYIPKGASIVENQWAINMDDECFQDPNEFRPERWLQHPDQPFPTFGIGRRSCPGKQWHKILCLLPLLRILWVYNIAHCYDVNGQNVPIDLLDTMQIMIAGPSASDSFI
jgi:cytochrome P450